MKVKKVVAKKEEVKKVLPAMKMSDINISHDISQAEKIAEEELKKAIAEVDKEEH